MQHNRPFSFRASRVQSKRPQTNQPPTTSIRTQHGTQAQPHVVQHKMPSNTQHTTIRAAAPAQSVQAPKLQQPMQVSPFNGQTRLPGTMQTLESILNEPITESETSFPGLQIIAMMSKKSASVKKKDKPKLERVFPSEEAECIIISQQYNATNRPQKEEDRNLLRWPVPDSKSNIVFNLCFYVREVQQFIVNNERITQEQTPTASEKRVCPMFQTKQIQTIFDQHRLEYLVPQIMDVDFRSVFLEYDLMPQKIKLTNDPVTTVVIEKLQEFIISSTKDLTLDETTLQTALEQQPTEEMDMKQQTKSKFMKVAGFFWYATKKALGFLGKVLLSKSAKYALWILTNPTYMGMILFAAKSIRIALCIQTSFPTIGRQTLLAFLARFKEVLFGYGQVIIDFATAIIDCPVIVMNVLANDALAAAANAARCAKALSDAIPIWVADSIKYMIPLYMKNYFSRGVAFISNTLWTTGQFLTSSINSIFDIFGCSAVFKMFHVMTSAEAEQSNYLGLGKHVTTVENIRLAFKTWSPETFDVFSIVFFLDIAILAIDLFNLPYDVTKVFARTIVTRIPIVGPIVAQALQTTMFLTVGIAGKFMNPLRYVLIIIRRLWSKAALVDEIYNFFHEIYEWITDLFPCLFKYVGDKLLWLMTLGMSTNVFLTPGDHVTANVPEQLQPTCCMTSIIRDLQRQFVFGEIQRRVNIRKIGVKEERSNVGWWNYAKSFFQSVPAMDSVLQHEKEHYEQSRALAESMKRHGGVIPTSFTTRNAYDMVEDFWRGHAETMTVTTNITGIPCVHDEYMQKIHIVGMERNLSFRGGVLKFYLCVDYDGSVRWHLSRNDMIAQFPNDVVYGDVDKLKVVFPAHLFSTQERMFLANMPIMFVRL